MGRFVNPDNSAFQVALNSKIYVDKTGLIESTTSVLNTTDAYICNSRPRRFGKSYAANMLAAYYSKGADSEKMFSGLQISKEADFRKHLNKYDVIHIDIQWFLANCEDVDNVVTLITDSVLSELREIYPDIFTWEVSRLPDALSIVREKTGQKFIIIIDEWDVLIRDAATKQVELALEGLNEEQVKQIIIAYEPIWAIGTGKTATSADANNSIKAIRNKIKELYGEAISENISILYGGSVKSSNAKELFETSDIDGALIGGASLKLDEFVNTKTI